MATRFPPRPEPRTPRKGRSHFDGLEFNTASWFVGLGLYGLVGVCLWVYWPGLSGPFLFDDFTNLESLGDFGQVDNWHSFFQYLTSGIAGPTGRPIALLSFLLNDTGWPSQPWPFKYTNLLIHVLNGVLLFWIALLLLRLNSRPQLAGRAEGLALASASLWMLHPIQVSTTLYVVQRMALLSTLFCFCGIVCYLKGREKLQTDKAKGYTGMIIAVVVFTPLAVLSKENGVILPILLAVLEFTVLRQQSRLSVRPHPYWALAFLGLPALTLILYLGRYCGPNYSALYAAKGYTLGERLLTESRILIDYLYHLAIPKLYTGSLFNDDFPISKGLLDPPTTLWALAAIVALMVLAWKTRKNLPLLSLALWFFFAGHLIESTVIPLDLYYDHRNYLPSALLFLPLAYGFALAPKSTAFGVLVMLAAMAGFTAAKARLWRNESELLLFWSSQHPNSVKAQRFAAIIYFKLGDYDKALKTLKAITVTHPEDFKLRLQYLALLCQTQRSDPQYLDETFGMVEKTPVFFDSLVFEQLEILVELSKQGQCPDLPIVRLRQLAETIAANPNVSKKTNNLIVINHLMGLIALRENDAAGAATLFARVLAQTKNPEAGLLESALLASQGYYREALQHLQATGQLAASRHQSWLDSISEHDFPREIEHLRRQIEEDMAKASPAAKPSGFRKAP